MATIDFKNAVGRIIFDAGLTEEGKIIQKSKTYRNLKENANAENLYQALETLAGLSDYGLMNVERVETATVNHE